MSCELDRVFGPYVVEILKRRCPGLATMRHLVLSFRGILCNGKVASLRDWMEKAEAAGIGLISAFVRQLRQDMSAVENGYVTGEDHIRVMKPTRAGRSGYSFYQRAGHPRGPHPPRSIATTQQTSGLSKRCSRRVLMGRNELSRYTPTMSQKTILTSRMMSSSGEKTVNRSGARGAAVARAKREMSSSPNGTARIPRTIS